MSASKEPPRDYLKLIGGTSLTDEIAKEDHSYLNPPKPLPARIQKRLDGLKGDTEAEKLSNLMKEIDGKRKMMGKYMPKKWVKKVKQYAFCEDAETPEAEKLIKELTAAGFTPQDFMFTASMIPAMHNADKVMAEHTGKKMGRSEMVYSLGMFTNWPLSDCHSFYDEWMTPEGLADNPFETDGDDDDAA